ncbi:hypothetical protein ASZ78_005361 [Callipepla squamata]|uniref:Tumor necrosis factor receptor superfamily member 1A n=1 Tax=Callipepla squamata TaxID=9009 RepID=A0A226NNC5_CALSU|nr:hypothetical protein ASZ78_005361 [Callipepla squamata]
MRGPALPRSSLGTVVLTFVCVLMEESAGIAPVPYVLQLRRINLDGRDPPNLLRREKRQMQCPLGQYVHPKGTHCCMRCHAGTYKSKDCEQADQAPVCLPCPNGTFTAVDNIMQKCFQCTRCRTELQQIAVSPCTLKQDTVCGCRKNQYQIGQADLFQCKNCRPCVNGIIANYGNLVLGIVVAIFAVICVLFLVNKAVKLVQKNGIASSFYSCVSLPQTSKEPVSEVDVKASAITVLPEIKKETELVVDATSSSEPLLQRLHELPDCVRPARKRQLPDNPAILYTVVDHVPPSRWKEFVRRLGLTEYDLERIEMEHRRLRDAQYEMVRLWKLQMGHAATVEHISCVLNQMELSGCSEAIQEAMLKQNSCQPCSFHSHL